MLNLFLLFLRKTAPSTDALYILGDLFEYWVGDDDKSEFNKQVITALHELSEKIPIYYMHGNRDFLIGTNFLKAAGCQLLKDPTSINLYGHKILLMHGDLLCTSDKKYQRFRKFSRCWLIQKLFLLRSLKKRKAMAANYRKKSESYQANAPKHIMDVTPGEAEHYLKRHNTNILIHGHTHRPAIHDLKNNGKRIVLGAWHHQGNMLTCCRNDTGNLHYDLINFNKEDLMKNEIL